MIRYLLARTIDNMRDLVGNYELNILAGKFISNEQSVLDLDSSYHFSVMRAKVLLLH